MIQGFCNLVRNQESVLHLQPVLLYLQLVLLPDTKHQQGNEYVLWQEKKTQNNKQAAGGKASLISSASLAYSYNPGSC